MKSAAIIGLSCALLGGGAAEAAQSFTNFQPGQGWQQVPIFSATTNFALIDGWSSNDTLTLADVGGDQFILLDAGERLSYTWSGLVQGAQYRLRVAFDYSGLRGNEWDDQNLIEISNDVGLHVRRVVETGVSTACNPSNVNRTGCQEAYFAALTRDVQTYQAFAASGPTLTLTFSALGNNSHAALDNVRITVTAVPEPESAALLLCGLGALVLTCKRRRLP